MLFIIAAVAAPSIAFVENQIELCSGNLLFQSQFYATAPTQTLFHSQTAAGTDTEAFAFSALPAGGITLAETSTVDEVAADNGFFTAFSSFKRFCCPTGEGYMHTSIGDPLVSNTPVFSGLIFPEMIGKDSMINTAGSAMPENSTEKMTISNITAMEPLINKQVSTGVGVQDTSNIMAVRALSTPKPTPQATLQPTPVFAVTATNVSRQVSPTPTPSPTPSPQPSNIVLPGAASLLAMPMSRQSNKPFTSALDPDYNPRTATRSEVGNISGWDRLTTNVIGRSGIDSTYANRTSFPVYINPSNVVLADQSMVLAETLNMTHAGSYLQQRMWAL